MADTTPEVRYVTKAQAKAIVEAAKAKYTNQDAIAKVKVGENTFTADEAQDQIELIAGSNVQLTIEGDQITISATDTTYAAAVAATDGEGGTDGLITAADQEKLDGIAEGSQANVLEGVQVNGTDQAIAGKKVNITFAEGDADGTVKLNGTDVAVHGLGTAAYVATESTLTDGSNLPTGSAVKGYVDGKLSTVYKPAGSVAFASLPALAAGVLGNVYNVTDAFTTTADFVEGAAKAYPAGTNVVVVDTDETGESPAYKFDVLPGFVDLSPYVESASLGGLTDEELAEVIAAL